MEGAINYKGQEIRFTIIYKDVKRIYLRIKYPDRIFVTCNKRASQDKIYSFIESKGDWILQGIEKYRQMPKFHETLSKFCDGETMLLFGKMLKIKNVKDDKFFVDFDNEYLYIHRCDNRGIKKRFEQWMRMLEQQAMRLTDRFLRVESSWGLALNLLAMRMFRLNTMNEFRTENFQKFKKFNYKINLPSIIFKNMRARWGSCNFKRGEITINDVMMKVEKPLIDFVLCHEIAHLVYSCHNKNFYNLLTAVLPDWRERKKVLNFKYFTLLKY